MSLQRLVAAARTFDRVWIGPDEAATLSKEEVQAYTLAHQVLCRLAIEAPTKHASGHPGGPLSAFTFAYWVHKLRDPAVDQPLRYSAGHLSVLAYGMQWLFGRGADDARLSSPQAIIDTFRTPSGLPGHVEAGIGDIPFGTGPLGKGVSHGLGTALGLKLQRKKGIVDVLLADGDAQEGQVMEAFRLASHLKLGNLVVHIDLNDVQLSDQPSRTVAADLAAIAHACGWQVIEVQNGNASSHVVAALRHAEQLAKNDAPICIVYYTTMGHGVAVMEEGSNTGKANFHGSPLKADVAAAALTAFPPMEELAKAYAPHREKEIARARTPVETDIALAWKPKGYTRAVTSEKGAARRDLGAVHINALMHADPRIIVLHADLAGSGGFDAVAKEFPERVLNVGVAEGNMAMMAAGLRQAGLLPVTYTFAAFGTNEARASSRLIDINCGHTRCGVFHDCTHAGISVGEDGETHQEQNYCTLPFRHTQVWVGADSNQIAAMAERAFALVAEGHESVYLFSSRDGQGQVLRGKTPFYDADYTFTGAADMLLGHGDTRDSLTILAVGNAVHDALAAATAALARPEAGKDTSIRVLNMACVRPIDAGAVIRAALETRHLLVVEDHNVEGGLATQVADVLADFQLPCSLRRLGLTRYYPSASSSDLKLIAGIDVDSIEDAILDELRVETSGGEDAAVTALYRLPELATKTRHGNLAALCESLASPAAIEAIRTTWRNAACPPERLPKTPQLVDRLQNSVDIPLPPIDEDAL